MPRLTPEDYRALEGLIDEMSLAAGQRNLAGADGVADERAAGEAFARSVELNTAFHRYIVERTGHTQLLKAWLAVNPLNWRFVTYTRLLNPRPVELAERHRSLVELFRRGTRCWRPPPSGSTSGRWPSRCCPISRRRRTSRRRRP